MTLLSKALQFPKFRLNRPMPFCASVNSTRPINSNAVFPLCNTTASLRPRINTITRFAYPTSCSMICPAFKSSNSLLYTRHSKYCCSTSTVAIGAFAMRGRWLLRMRLASSAKSRSTFCSSSSENSDAPSGTRG